MQNAPTELINIIVSYTGFDKFMAFLVSHNVPFTTKVVCNLFGYQMSVKDIGILTQTYKKNYN